MEAISDENPTFGIRDAYRIQLAGRRIREEAGERIVGRKVGLTSRAMQEQLGVDQPDHGYLTASMVFEGGSEIEAVDLIEPKVEAEIGMRLGADLSGAEVGLEEAIAAIEEIAPALEVIDSRIADWKIKIVDTIADNASSAGAVFGDWVKFDEIDLTAVEMTMRAGTESVAGAGAAVLGHPAEALRWLAVTLADYGEGLRAGQIILPGAMAKALPITAGDTVEATFTDLGSVSVSVV